ncbi:2-oxoglutarate and iron-dependent oxygenase JMJD4-like isoform X2 [Rhopilema esculentum]|uniref:2-oxoglutarate and iron-dependent oxygenase JMJD4-like isoform X2 n=1 Tax=Rhopilema esculentum TaxID=499914 RepID=UPI0031DCB57D
MVERISTELSLEQFQERYLRLNKPCVFSGKFTKGWRSRIEWVKDGKPNAKYLSDNFVVDDRLLYLKDWHFQREYPDYRAYEVLEYFQADWLNEWYDQNTSTTDDYRFVYMGPKGTWTSFHADVLRSYSWSANICGKKKWLIFPPGEEENLKDLNGNLPFDVTCNELSDNKKYPKFHKAVKPIEIIQEEGEIVFIPSCWHHQVHNLDHTISINHNWTNAYGINFVFQHLKAELLLVEKEISEFRGTDGWVDQCQLLLKCTAGLDYEQFIKMLVDLMEPRFTILKSFTRLKENADRRSETDHRESMEVIEAWFRRLKITCIPGEHLKISKETLSEPVGLLFEQEDIKCKMKNVIFDLEQLVEAFHSTYLEIANDEIVSRMNGFVNYVKEVSSFVERYCK